MTVGPFGFTVGHTVIGVCVIDDSNKSLLNQIVRASTPRTMKSHLSFDQFHALSFVAFTDSVNQSRPSTSRNPATGITGLIVGHPIVR